MRLDEKTKPEHSFYCTDGTVLKKPAELAQKLKAISQETYAHHTGQGRNDFHNWIKDIYQNEALALKIANARDNAHAAAIIEQALKAGTAKEAAAQKKRKKEAAPMPKRNLKKKAAKKQGRRKSRAQLHKKIKKHLSILARRYGFL